MKLIFRLYATNTKGLGAVAGQTVLLVKEPRDRVRAGLARAKAKGVILGRPQTNKVKELAIIETLKTGTGILKTARLHGVGTSVVQRIKNGL